MMTERDIRVCKTQQHADKIGVKLGHKPKEFMDISKTKEECMDEAMILMLTLPLEVLMDFYFTDEELKEFMPEFVKRVLKYYEDWKAGDLMMEEMKKNLWEKGGVKLEIRRK